MYSSASPAKYDKHLISTQSGANYGEKYRTTFLITTSRAIKQNNCNHILSERCELGSSRSVVWCFLVFHAASSGLKWVYICPHKSVYLVEEVIDQIRRPGLGSLPYPPWPVVPGCWEWHLSNLYITSKHQTYNNKLPC